MKVDNDLSIGVVGLVDSKADAITDLRPVKVKVGRRRLQRLMDELSSVLVPVTIITPKDISQERFISLQVSARQFMAARVNTILRAGLTENQYG